MDHPHNFDDGGYDYGDYSGNQFGRGQQQQACDARLRVDTEAVVEVDSTLYPESKQATHKIREKSHFIEMLYGPVDQEFLTVKSFYFFFYSAFGSLFPLMGIYFKQIGMNARQCGLLIGMRPFVEFLAASFWGGYAGRYKQSKKLLLASLASWIIFTVPLGFIQPEAVKCIERSNATFYLTTTRTRRDLSVVENINLMDNGLNILNELNEIQFINEIGVRHRRLFLPYNRNALISPIPVNFAKNYDAIVHKDYVSPKFSTAVYRTPDIQKTFFLLLLLVLIGEFLAAPAITLADSAVITLLVDDADKYSYQRMFGSLGWGLSMFFVGIVLDHSTAFSDHPCEPGNYEKNYAICFTTFSVLMTAAIITVTQISFKYDDQTENLKQSEEDKMQNQLAAQLNLPSSAVNSNSGVTSGSDLGIPIGQPQMGAESKMSAQTTRQMPEWVIVMSHFKDLKSAAFLFVVWFVGFDIGLIFTFLFWHLQDYGGSPTLFGIASIINHLSEIFAYFFSFHLITQIGHVRVLCFGLIGNVFRFLYISWLKNPWWILPFEFIQGITHAAVWMACCSYIVHNTPQHLRASSQRVLQGIHNGLGRGCGAVIGGMFVANYGTTATFRGYGITCAVVLAVFVFINFCRKEQGFILEITTTEDPHQVAEDTSHLAAHGVSSNPISRALSNTYLNDMPQNGNLNGIYQTSAVENLDIPGGEEAANSFMMQQLSTS